MKMEGTLVTLTVFTVLVALHEWGHMITARLNGIGVKEFAIGMGPALLKWKGDKTLYKLCLFPLGGYVRLQGDDLKDEKSYTEEGNFLAATPWKKIKVALAGPIVNYILAVLLFFVVFFFGSLIPSHQIGKIESGSLAEKVQLQEGDKISAINQENIEGWNDFVYTLKDQMVSSEGVVLQIERDGDTFSVALPQDELREKGRLGVSASSEKIFVKYPLLQAIRKAVYQPFYVTRLTAKSLWDICSGRQKAKDSFVGPIGIFVVTKDAAEQGLMTVLYFMAMLSVALGFFNLLPIPVLDGGQCVVFLLEWLFKKPVPYRWIQGFQYVSIALLLLLMVYVMYNDTIKFILTKN